MQELRGSFHDPAFCNTVEVDLHAKRQADKIVAKIKCYFVEGRLRDPWSKRTTAIALVSPLYFFIVSSSGETDPNAAGPFCAAAHG